MIGCMTFEMADILGPDKCIQGWYQLLDDERGMRENVPVATSITKTEHEDILTVKKFAVTLKRGAKGYGFSVNGYNPVYITRVQPGWSYEPDTSSWCTHFCACTSLYGGTGESGHIFGAVT
jgi:hypothetical protein